MSAAECITGRRSTLYWRRKGRFGQLQRRGVAITPEQYQELVAKQGGRCAICDGDPGKRGRLHVDHCHHSGHVRGLLCSACNTGIGQLGDDVERVRAAALYLETVSHPHDAGTG